MQSSGARRLLRAIFEVLLVTFFVCMLPRLVPGGPLAGQAQERMTPDQLAALQQQLGLNQPFWVHYLQWLNQMAHLNFGTSLATGGPVATIVRPAVPVTLFLDSVSLVVALVVSLALGALLARSSGALAGVAGWLGLALPAFVLGPVLVFVFTIRLHRLPAFGYVSSASSAADAATFVILPVVTLAFGAAAVTLRQARAISLGLAGAPRGDWSARRASLAPLIGTQAGVILSGTIVVEWLFGWPGIGLTALQSVSVRDYPVLQATVLIFALIYLVVRHLVDLLSPGAGTGVALGTSGQIALTEERRRLPSASAGLPSVAASGDVRWIFAALTAIVVLMAVLAPRVATYAAGHVDLLAIDLPPSPAHPLGTDDLGRDILSQLVYGARTVLIIGGLAAAAAAVVGAALGATSGRVGGVVDLFTDAMRDFPPLALVVALVAILGATTSVLVIALAVVQVPAFARVAQTYAAERQFKPGLGKALLGQAPQALAVAIFLEATLGFLGIGVQPPAADWGTMVGNGVQGLLATPWLLFGPALAIGITVLSLGLFGDALRDRLSLPAGRL